jgi:hypothetical protein
VELYLHSAIRLYGVLLNYVHQGYTYLVWRETNAYKIVVRRTTLLNSMCVGNTASTGEIIVNYKLEGSCRSLF